MHVDFIYLCLDSDFIFSTSLQFPQKIDFEFRVNKKWQTQHLKCMQMKIR